MKWLTSRLGASRDRFAHLGPMGTSLLADSLAGLLAGWLAGRVTGWRTRWLAGLLAGWLAGKLASRLAHWLTGWLVGWLAGLPVCRVSPAGDFSIYRLSRIAVSCTR